MNQEVRKKLESFFSKFPQKKFKKSEIMIDANENPAELFYLKKGYVREYAISRQGIELTLHVFAPGSYFPMMWVINNTRNLYYYESLTAVEAHLVPKNQVLAFFNKEPKALLDLTSRLLQGLDRLLFRIEGLVFGKAKARVISTVLFLARHFGEPNNGKVIIQYPFTHREIAAFTGVTRETASRELDKLQRKKLISIKNHLITIKEIEFLEKEV